VTPPTRPRLLDLFCCAGGASVGYARAGFDVTGIDIADRPRYPYPLLQVDALAALSLLIKSGGVKRYALVHASPPCQADCALTQGTNRATRGQLHPRLLPPLRRLLVRAGVPYVIEQPNGGAPIRKDVRLCGEMFGLGVLRHRNFELGGWAVQQPDHIAHRGFVRGMRHGVWREGPYVAAYGDGGGKASVTEMQQAMGIDWTDARPELTEAIPPAYTHWLGTAHLSTGVTL
jgi:hypothetical protein